MGSLEAPLKRELRSDAGRGARAALVPDDDAAPSGKDSPLRAPSVGASNDTADGPPWKRDTAVLGAARRRPERAEASAGPSPKKRRGLGSGPTLRARAAPSPPPELPDLHDLLTEFGRIELNADLLRAIQRTDAREPAARARRARALLDRAAFERVVAAAKLRLVADMRRLREASEDGSAVFLRAALRQYAMRAVAACAKQDSEDDDSDDGDWGSSVSAKSASEAAPRPGEAEATAAAELVRHLSVEAPEERASAHPPTRADSVSSRRAREAGSTAASAAPNGRDSRGSGQDREFSEEEVTAEWGSSLVCADLTINDIGSRYWPFRRGAAGEARGAARRRAARSAQGSPRPASADQRWLEADGPRFDRLIGELVDGLTDAIGEALRGEQGADSAAYHPGVQSLVAATAFDDVLRDCSSSLQSPVASEEVRRRG
ncbi:hypothetical protein QBZ16_002597 [Prototheca wickerhamii]|uniref:Uncharacterized protein n=1 Tax=Prototheca wickerhamii TaxID=3111 RepID=A0AAD9IMC6_PROWI|nr:hypothetical protein QBZ16_002597 [Prototheca wickerhamii]